MGKYSRHPSSRSQYYNEDGKALPLMADSPTAVKAYVQTDGKVYAQGFVDMNDNLEFFVRNERVYAKFIKDENFGLDQAVLDVAEGWLEYQSLKPLEYVRREAFASYDVPTQIFSPREEIGRFKSMPRGQRDKLAAIHASNASIAIPLLTGVAGRFLRTDEFIDYTGNNGLNPETDIWTTTKKYQRWFKPYKVNVFLKPETFEFANDLIIVKTGEYRTGDNGLFAGGKGGGMAKETICWVSPHEVILDNRWISKPVSFAHGGSYAGATGIRYKGFNTGVAYLSSKNFTIPNGELLSGNQLWSRQEADHVGMRTGVVEAGEDYYSLTDTDFYKFYTGQQVRMSTGIWDGRIPAGVPFKIECWVTNQHYMGFNGAIAVVPEIPENTDEGSEGFEITTLISGYGTSMEGYEQAAMNALVDGARKEKNAFDKKLIELGYAPTGRKFRKFLKFINPEEKLSSFNAAVANFAITGTGTV